MNTSRQKKNGRINIYIGLIIILFTTNFGCDINVISAGSYAYAETYLILSSEQSVITAVKDFKVKHPETVVPLSDVVDGRVDSSDHWFHMYFYLPKENRIVNCWTIPASINQTTFAIVGVNEGLELGNWKYINKDFNALENKNILINIEETLLNPIKQITQKNGL